jgi:hypothetical protein
MIFILVGLLPFWVQAQNPATFNNQSARPPTQPGQERHFLRAPDVLPGTLPEMRDVAYWVGRMKDPDGVVLSLPKIEQMNHAYAERVKHPAQVDSLARSLILAKIDAYPGLYFTRPSFGTAAALGAAVRDMIAAEVKYLRHTEFGNLLGIQYSPGELDRLEAEMGAGTVGDVAAGVTGMAVEAVCLRIVPQISPEYVGQPDKNRTRWDVWNLDILPIGSPVEILHVSGSGNFLLVLSDNGYGWVPADKIALASKSEIGRFADAVDFVVCTGDKVPFFSGADSRFASGSFRMGDRLPLVQKDNHRLVRVPVRQADGSLSIQQAWLAGDADVHDGYLSYTRRNVVTQSFKLLDNIYDWTGAWMGRNHATALRDIFACFGFRLPACGELLSIYTEHPQWMPAKMDKAQQVRMVLANDPFTTLQICSSGHSNLLLGDYQGVPILYDTHGYNYTDSTGHTYDIRRVSVETIALPDYFLKQDVTFIQLK